MALERKPETDMRNHPVWMELSRPNLEYNFRALQEFIGPNVNIIAMLKSNASGHGAVPVGRVLEQLGVPCIGVSSLGEAQELRAANIQTPLLIFDYVDSENIASALEINAALTISDAAQLAAIEEEAKRSGKKARVHVNIDTGMHLHGIWPPSDAIETIRQVHESPNLELEGIFSHFATAGDADLSFSHEQLTVFNNCLDQVEALGIPLPKYVSISNTAGILQLPETYRGRFTAVRVADFLLGLATESEEALPIATKPVLTSIKAKLGGVKTIPAGSTVSYGREWTAEKDTRIGIVPIGYADGYRRTLSNKGTMLIGGKRMPIVGLLSMNQTAVALPDEGNFKVGDEVVIVGKQGDQEITVGELADTMGVMTFEMLANLNGKRLPRILVNE